MKNVIVQLYNINKLLVIITFGLYNIIASPNISQKLQTEFVFMQKIPAFVITLSSVRKEAMEKFNAEVTVQWPELYVMPATGIISKVRGHGLQKTYINYIDKALDLQLPYVVFLEDDARLFPQNHPPHINITPHQQFLNLYSTWNKDYLNSPVLFLGGHDINQREKPNLIMGVTKINFCCGSYGFVIRNQHFIPVRDMFAKAIANAITKATTIPVSPDVLLSQMVSTIEKVNYYPIIASPLFIDHMRETFSMTWRQKRIFTQAGNPKWWKTSSPIHSHCKEVDTIDHLYDNTIQLDQCMVVLINANTTSSIVLLKVVTNIQKFKSDFENYLTYYNMCMKYNYTLMIYKATKNDWILSGTPHFAKLTGIKLAFEYGFTWILYTDLHFHIGNSEMLQLLIDDSLPSTSLIVQNENYLSTSVMLIRKSDWFDEIIDEWELAANKGIFNKPPYDKFALSVVLSKLNIMLDKVHHKQLMMQIKNLHQSRFHNTKLPFIGSENFSGESNNYLLVYNKTRGIEHHLLI